MKKKIAVTFVSFALIVAAALFIFSYSQGGKPIIADEPQVSSQPVDMPQDEQPNIEIPVPQGNVPAGDDAIVPTIKQPVASEPAIDTTKDKDTITPDTPKTNNPAPPADNTPSGGETQNGKIYVPGFGWIEDCGGGEGEVAEGMVPNGNIVGY